MEFEGFESSSIRREQNDPYALASDMIDDAFCDDEVSQRAAHEWFNVYFDNHVGQEVHATNERLRLVLLRFLTLDELLGADDITMWCKTTEMVRPIGLPSLQFAKIEVSFSLTDEQQSERDRLQSYSDFVVDENAFRQQLLALYQEVSFSIDYEFFSVHESYEKLPLTDIGEQYYDFETGYCVRSSHVDDGDFCERDLLTRPQILDGPEHALSEEEVMDTKEEITNILMAALHAGAVADAFVTAERCVAPHLLETVEYSGEDRYRFIDAAE